MSLDLYSRRLYWDGRRGALRANGVTVELRQAPRLGGSTHLVEVDYAPEVRVARLRESAEAWRDMTAPEVQAAAELLDDVSAAARAALSLKD